MTLLGSAALPFEQFNVNWPAKLTGGWDLELYVQKHGCSSQRECPNYCPFVSMSTVALNYFDEK